MIAMRMRTVTLALLLSLTPGALQGVAIAEELTIGEAAWIVESGRPQPGSEFGYSVAVDGDVAAIGTPGLTGHVHVYRKRAGQWEPDAYVRPDGPNVVDRFGDSVALDGNALLVGSRDAAFLFVDVDGNWTEVGRMSPGAPVSAVALDGDTAVIGCGSCGAAGAVFVYRRNVSGWDAGVRLLPDDVAQAFRFGRSVAIDGDTLLVGDPNSVLPGAAHVFVRTAEGWSKQAELRAPEPGPRDHFGWSVALQEDTALVGAIRDFSRDGSANVFVRSGGSWTLEAELRPSVEDSEFGLSLALDGNAALVGALDWSCPGSSYYGSAYVFTRDDSEWARRSRLVPRNGDCLRNDEVGFGWSVALDDGTSLVGAPEDILGYYYGARIGSVLAFDLPVATLNLLVERVESANLGHGTRQGLLSKLESALHVVGDANGNNDGGAVPTLEAFIRQVERHRGQEISTSEADTLVEGARGAIALIAD